MSTLGERIVSVCESTRGLTAAQAWAFACAHGWGNPHGSGGGHGYLAWCAVSASMRVTQASSGALTLAFGQRPKLSASRFAAGNASVPRIWQDAQRLGLLTATPRPGMLCLVEVRHPAAPGEELPSWTGRPGHIGIVVEVGSNFVRSHEGNYGGRDAVVRRPIRWGLGARERALCYVDLEKYEASLGLGEPVPAAPTGAPAPADDGPASSCADTSDLAMATCPEGADVLALADSESEPLRCRVVGETAEGLPLLQVVGDDGSVSLDAPVGAWVVIGCWGGEDEAMISAST